MGVRLVLVLGGLRVPSELAVICSSVLSPCLFLPPAHGDQPHNRRGAVAIWVVVFLYNSIYTLKIIHCISSGSPEMEHAVD